MNNYLYLVKRVDNDEIKGVFINFGLAKDFVDSSPRTFYYEVIVDVETDIGL